MTVQITDILGKTVLFQNARIELANSSGVLVVRTENGDMHTFILRNVITYRTRAEKEIKWKNTDSQENP